MSEQEDTLRSPNKHQQEVECGERAPAPENARKHPENQRENRAKTGVKDDPKTEKMKDEGRGTFP